MFFEFISIVVLLALLWLSLRERRPKREMTAAEQMAYEQRLAELQAEKDFENQRRNTW